MNRRPAARPGQLHLDLPTAAVATALRTRGMVDGAPRWFDAELMEAEAGGREVPGADRHRRLLPEGSGAALLAKPAPSRCRSSRCRRATKTVEYTLQMPTAYRDGRHELTNPGGSGMGAAAPARVTTAPLAKQDHLLANGQPSRSGGRLP